MSQSVIMCQSCHRLMRPPGAAADDFPGTVPRANPEKCHTCWGRERRENPPEVSPQNVAMAVSGLLAFLADRRRRDVPAEGVLMEGEQPNLLLDELISY